MILIFVFQIFFFRKREVLLKNKQNKILKLIKVDNLVILLFAAEIYICIELIQMKYFLLNF